MSRSKAASAVATGALAVLALALAAPPATGESAAKDKIVIGTPVATPAKPVAGKRLTVVFRVTRGGILLRHGTMMCDPSVGGVMLSHAESFKLGIARLSFTVPKTAAGKLLQVNVTVKADKMSATRVSTLRVPKAQLVTVSLDDRSIAEGNSGTTSAAVPVKLSGASSEIVTVDYATSDDTATVGSDYIAASGTVRFKPGETLKTIPLSILGDTGIELNETITVTLTNARGATIASGSGAVTITNDDIAKNGHYSGTTAQGRPISFDVGSGESGESVVANPVVEVILTCEAARGRSLRVGPFTWEMTGLTAPLRPDGSFVVSVTANRSDGPNIAAINGTLSPSGSATGGLRIEVSSVTVLAPDEETVRQCTSGDVSWNASA